MPIVRRYDLRTSELRPDELEEISDLLRRGALAIYPTDTLYAIGCRALDGAAVGRLREAKGRERDKPLSVIVADLIQARSLAAEWPSELDRLARAFWPGPLTLVAKGLATLPDSLVAGAPGIAMRVPASDLARALARAVGPLVATSANLSGAAPCLTVNQAILSFPGAGLALDVGELDGSPSTIVALDPAGGGFRVLREGRVSRSALDQVLLSSSPRGGG